MIQKEYSEKSSTKDPSKRQLASDHLANERTFLAWIRTGIGIMAFGFVVVKFSLFIRQLSSILGKDVVTPQKGYSAAAGIILVGMGSLTTVFSFVRYKQTEKKLISGNYSPTSNMIGIVTLLIFATSLFLIYYLAGSV